MIKKTKSKQNKLVILIFLICLFFLGSGEFLFGSLNKSDFKNNELILKNSSVDFFNATLVSDGYGGDYWNNGGNGRPKMVIDFNNTTHIVWPDSTIGPWGTDREIMYASSTDGITWSNATVISDGYGGVYWNNGYCTQVDIIVDPSGTIHVVWTDWTTGIWGTDREIMYVSSSDGITWSNATVISDGYGGEYWNTGGSGDPKIEIDLLGNIHVIWTDSTIGNWGGGSNDYEIMHISSTDGITWSNATVISDGYGGVYWNNAESTEPVIKTDKSGKIHVVWDDDTEGLWGTDPEVMYVSSVDGITWSNATVISDGYGGEYSRNSVSEACDLEIDNYGNLHVVWDDSLDMYSDYVIGYAYYAEGFGWSNMTVISDGYNGYYWSNDISVLASIAIDNSNIINVAWSEWSTGPWGIDSEVMHTKVFPDEELPIIHIPPDFSYREGETGNFINWFATDLHPANYTISRNTTELRNGTWQSGLINSINIDGLSVGNYIFNFEISDRFGHTNSDVITVTVKRESTIPFGYSWILFSVITIIGVVAYIKKKKDLNIL